jgi:hypothetical protein
LGNWNINIQGVGAHHNQNNPGDADKMFAQIVSDLKNAGHSIENATFTYGAKETPESIDARDKRS